MRVDYDKAYQELSRRNFNTFVKYTKPDYRVNWHHTVLMDACDKFAKKEIKKLMVFMPPQHGKELSHDTPILTPNGFIKHGSLKVGDIVYNNKGKEIKVLALSKECESEFVVTFSDGEQIECHGNHDWVVSKNRGKSQIVSTSHLFNSKLSTSKIGRGNRMIWSVDSNVLIDFDTKVLPINPYLLGYWLGDGTTNANVITTSIEDIQGIDFIVSQGYERHIVRSGNGTLTHRFKELRRLLIENNLYSNKHIPQDYIYNSKENRLLLLAGLIDSDGYVYQKNGRVVFSNTNNTLIKQIEVLLSTLGISFSTCEFKPKLSSSGIQGKKVVYQLSFNPTVKIPTVLKRKEIILLTKPKRRSVVSIVKSIDKKIGRCIEVEGGVYLAGEKLIPTHNSEIVSRRLPSYLLGINPKNRIIGCSYSSDLSSAFNRDVQRIIDDEKYFSIFPDTQLNSKNVVSDSKGGYLRNADIFEVVDHRGFYKSIGVGGSLTGTPADIGIIDDPIKDSVAAQSATFRARAWEWYNDVFLTRMHNDSQIILCMTRWDEDDLAGRILATEKDWHIVRFEAIAETPNELDPRKIGEPLWGEQHSLERLEEVRNKSPRTFHALYQQDPRPFEGGLVYDQFTIIDNYDKIEGKFKGYGLDFGFSNDPSALMEIKVIGNDCYISEKLYKNRLTTGDLIGHLHGIVQDKSRIEADSSRPDSIEEMNRAGFNVHPCVKGAGSIEERIDIVKRYNLFVDKNSLNLIRELKRYKWMEDKDGNAVRKPVDFMNHLMDCFYILQWYHKNVVVQPLKTFSRMAERKPIRKDFR